MLFFIFHECTSSQKFRVASRSICEPQMSYSDAYAAVLYHFVLMM